MASPGVLWEGPGASFWIQIRPERAQEPPRSAQDRSKRVPRGPQEGPKRGQESSRYRFFRLLCATGRHWRPTWLQDHSERLPRPSPRSKILKKSQQNAIEHCSNQGAAKTPSRVFFRISLSLAACLDFQLYWKALLSFPVLASTGSRKLSVF